MRAFCSDSTILVKFLKRDELDGIGRIQFIFVSVWYTIFSPMPKKDEFFIAISKQETSLILRIKVVMLARKYFVKAWTFVRLFAQSPQPKVTLKFCRVIYCPHKKQELCAMQLIGKNSFPHYSPYKILSTKHLLRAISAEDAVIITRLDEKIRRRHRQCRVLETDRNGTILIEDEFGKVQRLAEVLAAKDPELLAKLDGLHAYNLGYRMGQKNGGLLKG